jgi:hypothetical protein
MVRNHGLSQFPSIVIVLEDGKNLVRSGGEILGLLHDMTANGQVRLK